jgi:ABC-2 type transport system permease protein
MRRVLDITMNDLLQLGRDFRTFMFLILMPIVFTVLFGFAFGGFGGNDSDSRLPVGYLDQDDSRISRELYALLSDSDVIRLSENPLLSAQDLEAGVGEGELAAAVIVPAGYGKALLADKSARLTVIADTGTPTWTTLEAELLALTSRLDGAVRTATILEQIDSDRVPFTYGLRQTLDAWNDPPIAVRETTSLVIEKAGGPTMSLAHSSPGMMLQFSIAGLLTAAQVIVTERKSRTLQRLLTTATRRVHIVIGHYLAIFVLIFGQFWILIGFGQFVLRVDYLRVPQATALVAFTSALCVAALGLLIGILARDEEQAVVLCIVPMFVLSGLGGAWVPLEITGPAFQAIGHVSPVAWAMDGFENIALRGLGFHTVWIPAAALTGYAALFFTLAVWRLNATEEK